MKRSKTILSTLLVIVMFFSTGFVAKAAKPSKPPVTPPPTPTGNLKVHFLQVGQADCTLIMYNGENYLIDGATSGAAATILKYLNDQKITRLDKIFVTHPHNDHEGGLIDIVKSSFVDENTVIYTNGINTSYDQADHDEFLLALKNKAYTANILVKGNEVTSSDGLLKFKVLAPLKTYSGIGSITGDNNNSIVMRMTYGARSFLFTGDVENTAESELASFYKTALQGDVLKVPHHGGLSSAVSSFINAVKPKYAVISADYPSRLSMFSFPSSSTVSMLKNAGATVLITGQTGNIVFTCDGTNLVKN